MNDQSVYTLNIERSILSSVLFDYTILDDMESTITPEMFYLPAHALVFQAILDLIKEDVPPDEDFIRKKVSQKEVSDSVLVEILSATPMSSTKAYVDSFIESYKKRTLLAILNNAKTKMLEADGEFFANDIIDGVAKSIDELETGAGAESIKTVEEWAEYYEGLPPLKLYKTGLMVVDAKTSLDGGIQAGQFVFVSGKKETGKTYFATTIMENIAAEGTKCGFFSMEFGTRAYIQKLHEKYPHIDNKRRVAISQNVYVEHRVNDIAEVERKVRKMIKKGVEFIFIDSQLRVGNASMSSATKAEKLADTFSRIGLMCQRHEVVIMMVVQTSKADHDSEEISVKGCIDADHEAGVWFHFTKDKASETRTILIAKNKQNFKRRKVDVRFDPVKHDFKIIHEHDLDKGHDDGDDEQIGSRSKEPEVTQYNDWNSPQGTDDVVDVDIPDIL